MRSKLYISALAVLIAFVSIAAATFAWYTYNTNARSTKVKLAAGTSVSLSISNKIDGDYASNTVLEDFKGWLNPVSTDVIQNGFQKVVGYTNGTATQSSLVANLFGKGEQHRDYYKTSLFFKSESGILDLAVNDIKFKDKEENKPISTAIRVGYVIPSTGDEYIFSISDEKNPDAEYNTENGEEGHVLDSTKTDGSTIAFESYTKADYCGYDQTTGEMSNMEHALRLAKVSQEPLQVDVYLWLEGCDEDCTGSLSEGVLQNIAVSFCGVEE